MFLSANLNQKDPPI
uniref:Uncharacterized protein n=1 Tax=Arundo donax TaxID=35708 RepID=A0A0A9AKG4_ARUDO